MDKVRRKKIFYIPGIISLTILPFLFIYFANNEIQNKSLGVIPLFLADTNPPKKFPAVFEKYEGTFPPKRNYLNIRLTGNESDDRIKLSYAQIRIKEILSANDGANGLHFHFGDSSHYWTFVKAVDILRVAGAKTYMPLDNDLWFYHFPPDTTIKNWICGTTYSDVVYEEPTVSLWNKAREWTRHIWNNSWQIISSFIALLLSIVLLRRHKNGR